MKKFKETIEIRDAKGDILVLCDVSVVKTWYLYPLVFIQESKYLEIPELKAKHFGLEGLGAPDLPTNLQLKWIKCLFSWKRFRQKEIIPYVANLEYFRLAGKWANGSVNYFSDL